jgi:hypothetical protein
MSNTINQAISQQPPTGNSLNNGVQKNLRGNTAPPEAPPITEVPKTPPLNSFIQRIETMGPYKPLADLLKLIPKLDLQLSSLVAQSRDLQTASTVLGSPTSERSAQLSKDVSQTKSASDHIKAALQTKDGKPSDLGELVSASTTDKPISITIPLIEGANNEAQRVLSQSTYLTHISSNILENGMPEKQVVGRVVLQKTDGNTVLLTYTSSTKAQLSIRNGNGREVTSISIAAIDFTDSAELKETADGGITVLGSMNGDMHFSKFDSNLEPVFRKSISFETQVLAHASTELADETFMVLGGNFKSKNTFGGGNHPYRSRIVKLSKDGDFLLETTIENMVCLSIETESDGGISVSGMAFITEDLNFNSAIVSLDSNLDIKHGNQIMAQLGILKMKKTDDDGLILYSGKTMIKQDSNRNTLWAKELPVYCNDCSVQPTNDGGVYITTQTDQIKLNEDGDITWSKSVKGNGQLYSSVPTQDGYLFTGSKSDYGLPPYTIFGKTNEYGEIPGCDIFQNTSLATSNTSLIFEPKNSTQGTENLTTHDIPWGIAGNKFEELNCLGQFETFSPTSSSTPAPTYSPSSSPTYSPTQIDQSNNCNNTTSSSFPFGITTGDLALGVVVLTIIGKSIQFFRSLWGSKTDQTSQTGLPQTNSDNLELGKINTQQQV